MTEVRRLPHSEVTRISDIDRSERVTLAYEQVAAELRTIEVDWIVPNWHSDSDGEHSVAEQVRGMSKVLSQGAELLGAFDGATLQGLTVLCPELEPGVAQLVFLHVTRPGRRRGIGTALMDAVAQMAQASGATQMYVSSTPSESAVGFYLSQGFAPVEEPHPELLALEPDDIHMIREL